MRVSCRSADQWIKNNDKTSAANTIMLANHINAELNKSGLMFIVNSWSGYSSRLVVYVFTLLMCAVFLEYLYDPVTLTYH